MGFRGCLVTREELLLAVLTFAPGSKCWGQACATFRVPARQTAEGGVGAWNYREEAYTHKSRQVIFARLVLIALLIMLNGLAHGQNTAEANFYGRGYGRY